MINNSLENVILSIFPNNFIIKLKSSYLCLMDGKRRSDVSSGLNVSIVLKADQRSGKLNEGIVKDILTNAALHPHGIKVRLTDGKVGRIKEILE